MVGELRESSDNQTSRETLSHVATMLDDTPVSHTLHLKPLKIAKKEGNTNCYVWDQECLYYIQDDGSIDPVPITDSTKVRALFNDGLTTLTLTDEQIQNAITENGGNVTVFVPQEEKQQNFLEAALQWLIDSGAFFSRGVANNGNNISKLLLAISNATKSLKNVQFGFKVGGLVPAFFDFIELPFLVLSAIILGKKPPINLSNTARWLFAIGALALVIISIALPNISTLITLIISAYALVVGVSNFIELSFNFYQGKKSLQSTDARFFELQNLLRMQREQALSLHRQLEQLKTSSEDTTEAQQRIMDEFSQLKPPYDELKKELQRLGEQRKQFAQQKEAMSTTAFLNQIIILSLRVLAVIGAALVFCTPVIGHSLLVASGILITAILLAPLMYSFLVKLVDWIKEIIWGSEAVTRDNNERTDLSTTNIMQALPGQSQNDDFSLGVEPTNHYSKPIGNGPPPSSLVSQPQQTNTDTTNSM